MTERSIKGSNSIHVHVAKALGLGEKRESTWWFSVEEVESIKAEIERRKASKKHELEQRKAEALAAHLARTEAVQRDQGTWCRVCLARHHGDRCQEPAPRPRGDRKRPASDSFYTMPFIADPTLYKAVKFALHMRKQGKTTGLAVYRAAKYYGVRTTDVAEQLGRIGARKAIKNRIGEGYERGRSEEDARARAWAEVPQDPPKKTDS